MKQNLDGVHISLNNIFQLECTIVDLLHLLKESARQCCEPGRPKRWKPKLQVWSPQIKQALADSKTAHWHYKQATIEGSLTEDHVQARKIAKQKLRSEIRQETARKATDRREQIMDSVPEKCQFCQFY